jgi:hypothetical protein
MKTTMHLNHIEKSAFRQREYVAYINGPVYIRRYYGGWESYECGKPYFNGRNLAEVDKRVAQLISKMETKKVLDQYREQMKDYNPSAEQMHEMRSAFGSGSTVVNVFTGKKIKL